MNDGDWLERRNKAMKHPAQQAIEGLPHLGGGHWVYDLYPVRGDIARIVEPCSVFEFGAMLGWALVAFALGPEKPPTRIGWVDDESHTADSNRCVRENLRSIPALSHTRLSPYFNTFDALAFRQADLVAVDSDHSLDGTMRDLLVAYRLKPRVIVIDDMDAIREVREASLNFARWLKLPLWHVGTHNGLGYLDLSGTEEIADGLERMGYHRPDSLPLTP